MSYKIWRLKASGTGKNCFSSLISIYPRVEGREFKREVQRAPHSAHYVVSHSILTTEEMRRSILQPLAVALGAGFLPSIFAIDTVSELIVDKYIGRWYQVSKKVCITYGWHVIVTQEFETNTIRRVSACHEAKQLSIPHARNAAIDSAPRRYSFTTVVFRLT